ncbi:major facilitator superfamily domain-containing protein [Suillus clintonianus]|uniref:major facilitator superfamily domain-containing protein n=1 Tax=Suillus clintonianus TaxID=1904413 RepID=UPI001B8603AC|nr:major facilitator superfamily domain-containing protein [Suillus clintonianus]KAG2139240.1 major facilitator superfamily domain-containing protein [Suillus clintonianus]
MSMKPTIHDTFTANEKLDDVVELKHTQSSNSTTPHSESDPPDGGFRAWATVFGCFLMQFCGCGYISSFGVYQGTQQLYGQLYPKLTNVLERLLHANLYDQSIAVCNIISECPFIREFLVSVSVRWIGAMTMFLAIIVALISGPLYDRGWFYRLVIVGSLLQSLSLFALSFTKPGQFYFAFIFQGVLAGFGMGPTDAPTMAIVSHHFSKKRTMVMSLVVSGTSLGTIIHPIMLNHFLNGTVGFARGVRFSAGFVSALLLISCLSMRTRELPAPTGSYTAVARKCSREVPFILMTVGSTLFQIRSFFPVFYLQLDSVKHDIDINFSFYSLVIMNVACFIGRCTAGVIARYTGVLNFTIVSAFACSALIISMIALSNVAGVVMLGLAYGYFSGVYMALLVPLVTVLTPDLTELGMRIGICYTFISFSGLISGPISGTLLSSQYRWWIPSLFCGLISLAGSLMFVIMRFMTYRYTSKE